MSISGVVPSSAAEILAQATNIAILSDDICERTRKRLHSVMRDDNGVVGDNGSPVNAMPPYFSALRTQLWRIENHLRMIETCVRLTELDDRDDSEPKNCIR